MKHKSWHLDRRELLKGGGVALALPLLNGMGKAMGAMSKAPGEGGMPKRMLVSYFAYGAYMPDGPSGVPARKKNDPEKPDSQEQTTRKQRLSIDLNMWCRKYGIKILAFGPEF